MARRNGLMPVSALEMAQREAAGREAGVFYPLPPPNPGTAPFRLSTAALDILPSSGMRTLHVIGDHGGIADPTPQKAVAAAMVQDLTDHAAVGFCYSVGDLVYFNGAEAEYAPQFFEAYANYLRCIVGIPGNHDGDAERGTASLDAFMRYLCDAHGPRLLPEVAEFNRDTVQQPNPYWTLEDDALTIVGLYTNVPSGGQVAPDQEAWFVGELEAAPKDRPLIVALHHPPYSVDAHHGGSVHMGQLLDNAFDDAKRCPELVISGHVHDYQRFERQAWGRTIPYLVVGAGGYHNLHPFAAGAVSRLAVTSDTRFERGDDQGWGFLRLEAGPAGVSGEYIGVDKDGTVTPAIDTFHYPFTPGS